MSLIDVRVAPAEERWKSAESCGSWEQQGSSPSDAEQVQLQMAVVCQIPYTF